MDETFSTIDLVGQCLLDEERTTAFQKVIEKVVTPKSVVLDSGTGSGILAMFAARAGAKKVVALEIDPYIARLAAENIKKNNLSHIVEVVNEDIRNYHFSENEKFDVVMMEMLTTGMVDEYQVWAINFLHDRGVVDNKTVFIPSKQETHIALADTNFEIQGFSIKIPLHNWNWLGQEERVQKMSDEVLLNSIDFSEKNSEIFSTQVSLKASKDGTINSILLSSKSWLSDDVVLGETMALNGPVIIALEEERTVKRDEVLNLKVDYFFGNGYRNFYAKVV